MNRNSEIKPSIRYSEAFKIEIVRELERGGINFAGCRLKLRSRWDGGKDDSGG